MGAFWRASPRRHDGWAPGSNNSILCILLPGFVAPSVDPSRAARNGDDAADQADRGTAADRHFQGRQAQSCTIGYTRARKPQPALRNAYRSSPNLRFDPIRGPSKQLSTSILAEGVPALKPARPTRILGCSPLVRAQSRVRIWPRGDGGLLLGSLPSARPHVRASLSVSMMRTHTCSLQRPSADVDRLSTFLFNATVDLNPHQTDAVLFALKSPLSKGVLMFDAQDV